MYPALLLELIQPFPFVANKVTLYDPLEGYTWDGEVAVLLSPSPKFQLYVSGPQEPAIVLLTNDTLVPGQIVVSLAEKLTVGKAYTFIVAVLVLLVLPLDAVKVIVYVPAVT